MSLTLGQEAVERGGRMSVLKSYVMWLEFVEELVSRPSRVFPQTRVQLQLADTFDTLVSWNWENDDGTFGFELSDPIIGWPSATDNEIWATGGRGLHPLLNWFDASGDPRPMSIGRVPPDLNPRGALELMRDWFGPLGIEQQLSIPCHLGMGHRAFVLAKDGKDFSDEAFQLARLIHPLLALLWLQASVLERCSSVADTMGLTGRELAVLRLLADGLTAQAIAHRLGISTRTVHTHVGRVYRKLEVRDRLQAVLMAQRLGLLQESTQDRVGSDLPVKDPRTADNGSESRGSAGSLPRAPTE